jgi:hypothetical protein
MWWQAAPPHVPDEEMGRKGDGETKMAADRPDCLKLR